MLLTTIRVALATLFATTLALAVLGLPDDPAGLTEAVGQEIGQSGVEHPVTAVLLNFRAYDTWLEVTVLLLAVLALMGMQRVSDLRLIPPLAANSTLLAWLARMLTPVVVVAGVYLLWLGTHAPGGAFQAGAVLAGALVLLRLAGYRSIAAIYGWPLRALLLFGFAAFLGLAIGTLFGRDTMLGMAVDWAGIAIVLVEITVALATALTLGAMFVGGRTPEDAER